MQLPDQRALVLVRLLDRRINLSDAALLLDLCERSVRRLRARFLVGGPASLIHGNAGRPPAHALDPAVRARVLAFAKDGYAGLNDTHLSELLAEREGISLSRPSVRRILRGAGLASPRRRRAPRFRSRRQRRPAAGMLVQLDASRHRWLGEEGPELSLLGAIDDATGTVLGALFREQEDALGYLIVLRQLLTGYGVPLAVYSDRHSAFWAKPHQGQALLDARGRARQPTQLGRAFAELDVETIFASSPQAKGRIERLWGTLQDRLRSELRLAKVRDLEGANRFLERYLKRHNGRFATAPADPQPAWRALPGGLEVDAVCCFKFSRLVAADNTLAHEGRVLQLPPRIRGSYAHLRVEVRHYVDGSFSAHLPGGRELARSAVPETPRRVRLEGKTAAPLGGVEPHPRSVERGHPWRQWRPGQFRGTLNSRIPRSELA